MTIVYDDDSCVIIKLIANIKSLNPTTFQKWKNIPSVVGNKSYYFSLCRCCLDRTMRFVVCIFLSFFFFFSFFFSLQFQPFQRQESLFIYRSQYCSVHALKNIKNKSHDTIYTFKNYFFIMFSVSTKISCIQTANIDAYIYTFNVCLIVMLFGHR